MASVSRSVRQGGFGAVGTAGRQAAPADPAPGDRYRQPRPGDPSGRAPQSRLCLAGAMALVPTLPLTTPDDILPIPQLGFGVWQVPDARSTRRSPPPWRPATATSTRPGSTATRRVSGGPSQPPRSRGRLFVTTKVWPDDYGRKETPQAFDRSMDRLGLDVLDLFLLHWPAPAQDRFVGAWRALREIRDGGPGPRDRRLQLPRRAPPAAVRRDRGVAGDQPDRAAPLPAAGRPAGVPRRPGILTEAWSPLASGSAVLDDPVITDIAASHGATPAQAILALALQLGNFVILQVGDPGPRIAENFDVYRLELTADDMAEIAALDRGMRTGPDPRRFTG